MFDFHVIGRPKVFRIFGSEYLLAEFGDSQLLVEYGRENPGNCFGLSINAHSPVFELSNIRMYCPNPELEADGSIVADAVRGGIEICRSG